VWPTDTFVDFDHGINNAIKRLREALGDIAETPRYIETLPRRGYRFVERVQSKEGGLESLAVLPLENLSRDPEQEYFADGLTEALITSLAKVGALRVVSRTSAMQYKGIRNKPVTQIARELGVDAIVEGTVIRSGDRVRISAQLIDASTDTHLWAESYDRDMRDMLKLHLEIARAIASEVRAKLTPLEQVQLSRARTVDPDAYEAYLKGRYFWNQRKGEGLKKGVEYFQRAVQKDPSYAAAYAGLADSASTLGFWGYGPPEACAGRAKSLALKALEIEESSAEAHASLAWASMHYDRDALLPESEYRRSIQLDPRYATVVSWHSMYLACRGFQEEAFAESGRALDLDPLSKIINVIRTWVLYCIRRQDEAREQGRRTLELDPDFPPALWILAAVYEIQELYEPAITCIQHAIDVSGHSIAYVAELGRIYAAAGKHKECLAILEQLETLSVSTYVMAIYFVFIYAARKELDPAFAWLEKAYQERSPWIIYVNTDPRFDNLRSDRRFGDLLRRMNFTT